MNNTLKTALLGVLLCFSLSAQKLQLSNNQRFLVTEDGAPFFWMADTAWELFHRCDSSEITMYLDKRASQEFNVIQAVALAELDGLQTPSANNELPLLDNDPTKPNPAYFDYVAWVVKEAEKRGLFIALLPTWGDKLWKHSWGLGPEIFDTENAFVFGEWMGNRFKNHSNIIWVLGGDRNPRDGTQDAAVWNQMAQGILKAYPNPDEILMTFHPQPKEEGGSSTWFHSEAWLDFNMHQTGHCANRPTYELISHDYALKPTKPVLDGEPLYEEHPNCFNAKELGHSLARDIRRIMYWNVFSGAFGQSYGCHAIWQMYDLSKEGINAPLRPWKEALDLPMANQVKHLKNLMLSRPYLNRIPDTSLVQGSQEADNNYTIATRDDKGTYAMVYFPKGTPKSLDLDVLEGNAFTSWWYDPRTGTAFKGDAITTSSLKAIPPSQGVDNDWILIIDKAGVTYPKPGTPMKL
ncbi:MAG: glycoside hydrolase family 140 protein [Bacteroidota bacterium]